MRSRIKKPLTAVIAVLLSLTMAFSCSAAGFSDILNLTSKDPIRVFFTLLNMITTDSDKKDYIERPVIPIEYTDDELKKKNAIAELINHDLNRIKTVKPAFTATIQRGLPGTNKDSALEIINRVSSIAGSITTLIWGNDKNPFDVDKILESIGITGFFSEQGTVKHLTGVNCDNTVSVQGQSYVSELEGKDIYYSSITKSRYDDSYTFKIELQDAINPDENSAHAKVFDLFSDVQLFKTIGSLAPSVDWSVVKIRYVDCYLSGRVDKYGNVAEYTTHYKCILQVDTSEGVYDINQYIDSINNTEIYESKVTYAAFNWEPRPFGDVNNDGKINSADARYVLRIAAKLDQPQEDSLLFGDMNFDGKLNSSDARILLRIAGKLQEVPPNAVDGTL